MANFISLGLEKVSWLAPLTTTVFRENFTILFSNAGKTGSLLSLGIYIHVTFISQQP